MELGARDDLRWSAGSSHTTLQMLPPRKKPTTPDYNPLFDVLQASLSLRLLILEYPTDDPDEDETLDHLMEQEARLIALQVC